jgi:hypothetical protein
MTKFDGVQPTDEENEIAIRKVLDTILSRKPCSMVIFAEFKSGNGGVVTGAVGSPLTLTNLVHIGRSQLEDMMRRSLSSGENG